MQPPHTICLLDDEPAVLKALSRIFSSAGWTVVAFADPIEFLEHATSHHPPVAVIDMSMPAMNGLEVQADLRKRSPQTEVIFLTGSDDQFARDRAIAAGACAYMLKTADAEELLSITQSAIGR